jgi:peptide/nickel transport system permease protein
MLAPLHYLEGFTMRYFIRRFLFFLLTLWTAVTLNFIIPRLQPGDPAEAIVRRLVGQNKPIDPAQVHAIRLMLGIPGGNIFQQYIDYLGTLFRGEFGISYTYFPYKVTDLIAQSIWWTLGLVLVTNIIGFVVGNILGAFAAWRRNSTFDSFVSVGLSFVGTLPYMWIALVLLFLLAFQFQVLPMGGGFSETSTRQFGWDYTLDIIQHATLPAISILITGPIGWIMGMRNNMIQTLGEDYTRLAIAKGLKPWKVALLYSARNAILPNVTGFAMSLGGILGGVVVVESVFSYPGMGLLFFESIGNRDYPLMQTIFLFSTIGVLLANLLADFVVGWLDPRVRKGEH